MALRRRTASANGFPRSVAAMRSTAILAPAQKSRRLLDLYSPAISGSFYTNFRFPALQLRQNGHRIDGRASLRRLCRRPTRCSTAPPTPPGRICHPPHSIATSRRSAGAPLSATIPPAITHGRVLHDAGKSLSGRGSWAPARVINRWQPSTCSTRPGSILSPKTRTSSPTTTPTAIATRSARQWSATSPLAA